MSDAQPEEIDAIFEQLRQSFLETATQKLDDLDTMLNEMWEERSSDSAVRIQFLGELHSLKGMGGTFQFPVVSVICHHLETYLEDGGEWPDDQLSGVQIYLDAVRQTVDSGVNPDDDDSEKIVSELPHKQPLEKEKLVKSDLRVLLVTPAYSLRQLVEFYLVDSGCTVTKTDSAFDGFRIAVIERPELVISSVEMNEMGGVDLGRALMSVSKLPDLRFCLLTGSSDAGELAQGLPDGMRVIRTGNVEGDIENVMGELVGKR